MNASLEACLKKVHNSSLTIKAKKAYPLASTHIDLDIRYHRDDTSAPTN